ncbi:MAG: Ig-like domain repeat protein [Candidatus Dormibacteraeota bacterium]|uniref:Ig-like domain repeat protein n=1 Tax=Candidatus Dormiibacter inghamiae TaxID=3127013 RepID=A0A934K9Q2_9BACT|nr:Ig-like domain repeat protein [Candidatus Dormibacteraeota bacterium]
MILRTRRRLLFAVVAALTVGGVLVGGASTALAGVLLGVAPTFPAAITVGDVGQPASLHIRYDPTVPDTGKQFTLDTITLVPSCGSLSVTFPGNCPAGSYDPGVFQLSTTGVGAAGTTCAGIPFTITVSDAAQGKYTFVPASAVILGAATGFTCDINFTFDVLKRPTIDVDPSTPGMQTGQIGFVNGATISVPPLTATAQGTAIVTIKSTVGIATQVAPTAITIPASFQDTATLTPATGVPAPTGTVTFNVYGPNNATCTGTPVFIPSTNTVTGGTALSDPFTPTVAGTYRVIATYSGDANYAASASACNAPGEAVAVTAPPPTIGVTKSANPSSRIEPGGTFTFTAQVTNPSTTTPVTINSLIDNVYGDLATRPGSTCGALIGVTLAPGASSATCTFTGTFTGTAGASQTDTITVTGSNAGLPPVTATAQATVTITTAPPQIAVTKVASPLTQVEPGGTFTFTAQVSNPSTLQPVTITGLTDNIYGNLATRPGSTCGALIGVTLAPGASSAPCTFTGPFTGRAGASQTDTITVTGTNLGTTVTATAQATVTLTPAAPEIAVTKVASPLTQVEPGGTFTYTAQVSNPSTLEPVTITSLVDNIYGDLATRPGSTCGALIGVTLAPGASSAPCTFTGPFTGRAGDSQTDTITVTGTNLGTTVTATAEATVALTPAPAQIAVTKVASPPTQVEPGGNFTFTATVSNPSPFQPVTITRLTDNVYGDLATRPGSTCGVLIGITLTPGASVQCSFTGGFTGKAGDAQTDTITVDGTNLGATVTATADATVTLTAAPAPPPTLPPTGGGPVTPPAQSPSLIAAAVAGTALVQLLVGLAWLLGFRRSRRTS